ncbi:dTMP kinase [Desulfitobacterium metallireducens]|uniref:Thymidylate kinase n=1 Tax=Desulfitobacterium metallireducens DSM 15288 TaxID=871968 RepID=W0ECF2_9FIRM|nr:thymidylate kinase [Desulfitobacterium metallireducens]AHF06736.1 thymidylate kinase [Desulfitobacterium metallireducens DSM 15288]
MIAEESRQGKLIIIEAGDGSGKATQTLKLFERLQQEHLPVKKVEFPNYDSPSSALVKMYLEGNFGRDPNAVNPYVASTFYTVDRFASFKTEWEMFYREGGIILADRYTTSNMVHQAAKISDRIQRSQYLDWLKEFEYKIFELPEPDLVIFLDMPPQFSLKLIEIRSAKSLTPKDIHEKSPEYLRKSYGNALEIANIENWTKINCINENQTIKSVGEIHQEVYEVVKALLD